MSIFNSMFSGHRAELKITQHQTVTRDTKKKFVSDYPPGLDLYKKVRGAFISRHSSLTAYCKENNIPYNNARQCLFGLNNGEKGQALRVILVEAANIPPLNQEEAS